MGPWKSYIWKRNLACKFFLFFSMYISGLLSTSMRRQFLKFWPSASARRWFTRLRRKRSPRRKISPSRISNPQKWLSMTSWGKKDGSRFAKGSMTRSAVPDCNKNCLLTSENPKTGVQKTKYLQEPFATVSKLLCSVLFFPPYNFFCFLHDSFFVIFIYILFLFFYI